MILVALSVDGRDAGAGVMVEVSDPGLEAQELLSTFPSLEALLLSFVSPW